MDGGLAAKRAYQRAYPQVGTQIGRDSNHPVCNPVLSAGQILGLTAMLSSVYFRLRKYIGSTFVPRK
jgi:hypothetical protein